MEINFTKSVDFLPLPDDAERGDGGEDRMGKNLFQ